MEINIENNIGGDIINDMLIIDDICNCDLCKNEFNNSRIISLISHGR